jgi:hypothetical protein
MGFPIRIDGLLAKIESNYGADSVPVVGTDGVKVSERLWSTLSVDYQFPNDRKDEATGTLQGGRPAPAQGPNVGLDILWRVRGSGTATTPPEASPLLRSCGLGEAITTLTRYTRADASHGSCSVYAYGANQLLYKILGVRGSVRWDIRPGALQDLRFRMRGILSATPGAASTPVITYDAAVPPPAVSMALAVGAWTPAFHRAAFELGADLQLLESGNPASGIDQFAIGEFNPRFELGARMVVPGTYDPIADIAAGTARAITATLGSATGNRMQLNVTNADIRPPIQNENQNGFAAWGLTYDLADFQLDFD